MVRPDARSYLGLFWILLVALIGMVAGSVSAGIVLLLLVSAVVPPLVMLALWKNEPPLTVAEVLYKTERS